MLSHDRQSRFSYMQREGAQLRQRFEALTAAHGYFHGAAALQAISVSDVGDDGGIEAVFMDVRIRFQMLLIFSDGYEPRGRVICMHCHCAYGHPVRDQLGAFTFDVEGNTDLDAGIDGKSVTLQSGSPHIVLMFLERALAANRTM